MTKHLRTVKASFVLGILLVSLFVAFIPSTSASVQRGNRVNVKMDYDPVAASEKIVPLSGEIEIPIYISTKVEGLFANFLTSRFPSAYTVSVDLSVQGTKPWFTAWISPNVVNPDIGINWRQTNASVHISFNENAPAHESAIIDISMHAYVTGGFGRFNDKTTTAQLSFVPSYLPIIDATPKTTYMEISPGEIGLFDIDLENLGNAETEFLFTVIDVPEGWSANIVSNTKVGSKIDGDDPTKTIQLSVQPPFNFGYHNERKDITIGVRGRFYAGASGVLETDTYEIIFTVQNRGFSTPGFEIGVMGIALLIIISIIYKKKQKD